MVIAVGVAAACKSGSPDKAKPVDPGSGSASGSGSADTAVADPPPPPQLLHEDQVRALIAQWVAAQNSGDFAAYDAVYAEKLEGVKRAKGRTWRFDRDGWMTDRKRMFANKMTVEASDIAVKTLPTIAIVDLTQAFTQGKFHDEGAKRIVVILQSGAPKIAREEMLSSVSPVPDDAGDGVYLVDGDAIFLQIGADEALGHGKFTLEDGDPVIARRPVPHPPAEYAKFHSSSIPLYAPDGTACKGTIGDLYLQGGETPHFGTRAEWDGQDGDKPYTEQQIAQAVFSNPNLLGALTVDAECTPAVAISKPAPTFFPPSTDADLEAKAVKAFRKTDEYKSIQDEFKDSGGSGQWAPSPAVTLFGNAGGVRYASVNASEGDGCGAFHGETWALWSVAENGAMTRIAFPEGGVYEPHAIFTDGDGDVVHIIATGSASTGWSTFQTHLMIANGELTIVERVEYPYLDCPC